MVKIVQAIQSFWPEYTSDRWLLGISLLGFLLSLYLLFFFTFHGELDESMKVGVLRTEKSVQRRHAKRLRWADIEAEGDIYFKDLVYVPKSTKAVVTLKNGRVLNLEPDSMVQFDEFLLDGIQISLFDFGLFRLMPYPRVKRLEGLPDPRPLELLHEQTTDRLRAQLKRSPAREPLGTLDALVPLDNCKDYDIRIISPLDEKFNLRKNQWLNLAWTPVPLKGVEYQIQVARRSDFKNALVHKTRSTRLVIQFDDQGTYFWRISAKCAIDANKSETHKFGMALKGGKEKAFVAEISHDREFYQIFKTFVVERRSCPREKLPKGTYYCRVRPISGGGDFRHYDFAVP